MNMNAALRVVVADDHPLFRRAIVQAIREDPLFDVVGIATTGEEALDLIEALEPDVAVLDHRMPGRSGIGVCAEVTGGEIPSRTAVLMLSAFDHPDVVTTAMGCGASGYLAKTASPAAVRAAIEKVARGGIAYDRRTEEGVARALAEEI